jgi:hypothetical protein
LFRNKANGKKYVGQARVSFRKRRITRGRDLFAEVEAEFGATFEERKGRVPLR